MMMKLDVQRLFAFSKTLTLATLVACGACGAAACTADTADPSAREADGAASNDGPKASGTPAASPEGRTGSTSQALSFFGFGSWGTRRDQVGLDLGYPENDYTCFLAGVLGNISEGGGWGVNDVSSWAGAKVKSVGYNGPRRWHIEAHGGASETQNDTKGWFDNPVNASVTCVPYVTNQIEASWKSFYNTSPPAMPKKITSLLSDGPPTSWTRQCFLKSIEGKVNVWDSDSKYARVVLVRTTDDRHPDRGWYVESNAYSANDKGHVYVSAICVDFPPGVELFKGSIDNDTNSTQSARADEYASGVKGCGLTSIGGGFDKNSWTDGVNLKAPSSQTGAWNLEVSPHKSANVVCAR